MRVLFVTIAEKSHLYSMVPTAWACLAAGHEVRVASSPYLVDTITRTGLTAVPVGTDTEIHAGTTADRAGQEVDAVDWSELDPGRLDWASELVRFQYGAWGFAFYNDPLLPDLVEYARGWRPDLVVWDALSFAGGLAAHVLGVPHARFLSFADVWAAKRRLFLDLLARQPAGQREDPFRDWLGGRAGEYGREFTESLITGDWTIDPLPARLTVRAVPIRLPVRFTPYNGPAVIPDWLREPPDRPRVCVSLGTANTERYGGDFVSKSDLLAALAELDAEIVAALLPAQCAELGPLPGNVRPVHSVPLHALLPSCAAVVHHGGFGTFATAMSAGVPALAVATPLSDQTYRCQRLVDSGAGLHLPHTAADPARVRDRVHRLLSEPQFTASARQLAAEAAAHPTPHRLVPVLEQLTAGIGGAPDTGGDRNRQALEPGTDRQTLDIGVRP